MNDKQLKEFCDNAAEALWESAWEGGDILCLKIIDRFLKSKDTFDCCPPEYIHKLCLSLDEKYPFPPSDLKMGLLEQDEWNKKAMQNRYSEFIKIVSKDLFNFIKEEAGRD